MAFRRKMKNCARLVLGKQAVERRAVADIRLGENVTRIVLDRRQRLAIAGIGQLVDVDDATSTRISQPI